MLNYILLDGASFAGIAMFGLLFIVIPMIALIFLVILFIRYKKKRKQTDQD